MGDNYQKDLGSENLNPKEKEDIQKKGGQASYSESQNQDKAHQDNEYQSESETSSFGDMNERRNEQVGETESLNDQSSGALED